MENLQLALARDFVEFTGENIFLTGRAGTGKTTFLRHLREALPKRMIVVAPTGVAAINAGGVTMHSFFQLPIGVHIPGVKRTGADGREEVRRYSKTKIAIIKSLDLLVIDEISMVRADVLDGVDEVLRRFRDRSKPFGGVQLLMIGDVGQLAPVAREEDWALLRDHYRSPFFFDSIALRAARYTCIELKKIYRQNDPRFIELLSRVREGTVDGAVLAELNSRYVAGFEASEGFITLTSHNHAAKRINDGRLAALPGEEYSYAADVEGDFPEYLWPSQSVMRLREGAQVMFTRNDASAQHRYVNGTIGRVTKLGDHYVEVLPDGAADAIAVEKATWDNRSYALDPKTRQITETVEGTFTQYPLKTAWAITIHKSQGLTFDRVVIDAADSFSHGQVYVALSRCRTLEGIVLSTPLGSSAIVGDGAVKGFSDHVERSASDGTDLAAARMRYYENMLGELFDFGTLYSMHRSMERLCDEHLFRVYPHLTEKWREAAVKFRDEVFEVGMRFGVQIGKLMGAGYENDPVLRERVVKGSAYFLEKCTSGVLPLLEASRVDVDNKEVRKSLTDLMTRFGQQWRIKLSCLASAGEGFDVRSYLETKAAAIVDSENAAKSRLKTPKGATGRNNTASRAAGSKEQNDIVDEELFSILRTWRNGVAAEKGVSAFVVASQKTIIEIANTIPASRQELLEIKGVGKAFAENYGFVVLQIIEDYRAGRIGEH